MRSILKSLTTVALGLTTTVALAIPTHLITHNRTSVESNAYIGGVVPSPRPTPPHSDRSVNWAVVLISCSGHTVGTKCSATIKMAPNSPDPITIGTVTVDLKSGDITPKQISANGYTLTVNGPAETTITED